MTSISFPLKKFPGQFSHRSMVFTGRASAHIIILTLSVSLHCFLIQALQVRWLLDALLYSLPMIGSVLFQIIYLVNVRLDDADYFDMSLKKLKERYEGDSRYFDNMGVLGFLASVASLSYASMKYIQEGFFSPLITASNACLLFLLYYISLHKGLYTNKRVTVYVLSLAIIETGFIAASISGMHLVSFAILCVTVAYLLYERSKGHNLYELLQDIIK